MAFEKFIESMLEKIKVAVKTDTIIGDPITVGDKTLIPVTKVTFGFGIGGEENDKKASFGGGSGGGATVEPIGFLVVYKDRVDMVPLKEKDTLFDKLIDPGSYDKLNQIIDLVKGKINEDKDLTLKDEEPDEEAEN
jgi:sporulation protein YtfJ